MREDWDDYDAEYGDSDDDGEVSDLLYLSRSNLTIYSPTTTLRSKPLAL